MKAILTASIFAFSVSAAAACGMQKSVQAETDPTIVASIADVASDKMSKPLLPLILPEDAAPSDREKN